MSVEPAGFHARDRWHFRREPDGSVRIWRQPQSARGAEFGVTLDVNTWASAVAAVSVDGETAETFQQALAFHGASE